MIVKKRGANKILYFIIFIFLFSIFGHIIIKANEIFDEELIITQINIDDDFADDTVIIVLKHNVSLEFKNYTVEDFCEINCIKISDLTENTANIVKKQIDANKTGDYSELKERIEKNMLVNIEKFHRILCLYLSFPGKENVIDAIKKLEKRDDIISAEPNYFQHIASTSSDPYFLNGDQWGLDGINGINITKAWNYSTGDCNTLVGVIDSGIDVNNHDLTESINYNLHIDCVNPPAGYSYVSVAKENLKDENGHGTHVAGIIGAKNNNLGIVGVLHDVRLVSLRISDKYGESLINASINAIDYATSVMIPILNYSNGTYNYYNCMYNAIFHYPGLFICAAGNDNYSNDTNPSYPSNFNLDNLISVGAIDEYGVKSEKSNYGLSTVDIFAPGDNVLSTYSLDVCESLSHIFNDGTHLCELDRYFAYHLLELIDSNSYSWEQIEDDFADLTQDYFGERIAYPSSAKSSHHKSTGYHFLSGTSMATPFVTAVAALMLSINNNLTPSEIKLLIMNNSSSSVDLHWLCVCGGRLDAFKAISAVVLDSYTLDGNIVINGFNSCFTPPLDIVLEIPSSFSQITSSYSSLLQEVKIINSYAFQYSIEIKKLIIPSTVTNIGSHAFYGCTSLEEVELLKEKGPIINLGLNAFDNCASNLSITVPTNRLCEYKNAPF